MVAMIFGMGATEILLICGIALLVLGPKKLPELAGKLGKTFGELKGAANDFKQEFERAKIDLEQPLEPRESQPAPRRNVTADSPDSKVSTPPHAELHDEPAPRIPPSNAPSENGTNREG